MIGDSKNSIGNKVRPPFFIMGCPRSGTTLVAQILDSHSRIAVYLETNYYALFRSDLDWYGDLGQTSNLERLISNVLEAIRVQGVTPPAVEDLLKALVAPTFEGVLTTLLHLYAQQQGKVIAGEKSPMHCRYLAEILENFPESPVIYVMRDPRDVVRSMQKAFGVRTDGAVELWNEAFLSYSEASRPVHLVRYEELVRKPVEAVGAMCAFLGQSYEPTMLRFFERIPEHIRRISPIDLSKLSGPVVPTSVGNFREMSTRDLAWIEAACAVGMGEMGYPFSTGSPRRIDGKIPQRTNVLRLFLDRVSYYRLNPERWRRGWFRWKMMLHLRAHYLLALVSLRNGKWHG